MRERRFGTQTKAIEYCKKEGNWTEAGNKRIQGEGTDLKKIKNDIINGKGYNDIIAENDFNNFSEVKLIQHHYEELSPRDRPKPEVFWIYGPTGTGKSKLAKSMAPRAYWKNSRHKWWNGYGGTEDIIIDDFRGSNLKFDELLRLLDEYPLDVETKGGTRWIRSKRIFITTPRNPQETYPGIYLTEDIHQLLRRIDHTFCLDKTPHDRRSTTPNSLQK